METEEPLIVRLARRRQESNLILPHTPMADLVVDLYDDQPLRTPIRRLQNIIDPFRPLSVRLGELEVKFEEKLNM